MKQAPLLQEPSRSLQAQSVTDQGPQGGGSMNTITMCSRQLSIIKAVGCFVRNSFEARQMGITAPNGLTLLTKSGYDPINTSEAAA